MTEGKMRKQAKRKRSEDSITSSDDSDVPGGEHISREDQIEESYANETKREKHIRLTKKALHEIKACIAQNEDPDDLVTQLQNDAKSESGKLVLPLADKFTANLSDTSQFTLLPGHKNSVYCLCISTDAKHLYTGDKNSQLVKWSLLDLTKVACRRGGNQKQPSPKYHNGPILAMSVASNEHYLATGGADHKVIIWLAKGLDVFAKLTRHQSPVTAVSFRIGSYMLFTGDRNGRVCVWNMPLKDLIQDIGARTHIEVNGLTGLRGEKCVSCTGYGGPGVTLWKVAAEVCAQYEVKDKTYEESMECIYAINEELVVTGSVTNKLYLWHMARGSPVQTLVNVHSGLSQQELDQWRTKHIFSAQKPCLWVTALAGMDSSDLIASGSSLGEIIFWRVNGLSSSAQQQQPQVSLSKLSNKPAIRLPGVINGLAFSPDGRYLCVALGHEYRLGRWNFTSDRKTTFLGKKSFLVLIPLGNLSEIMPKNALSYRRKYKSLAADELNDDDEDN